jgi:LysM repeat protein
MKTTLLLGLIALLYVPVYAQSDCPPSSNPAIHIVQGGETLYSIAKKYKISLSDLMSWNNRTFDDVLMPCTSLKTRAAIENAAPSDVPKSYNAVPKSYNATATKGKPYIPSNKKTHIVQVGESLLSIANQYGYTPERLLVMNGLNLSTSLYEGQELSVCDCLCGNDGEKRPNSSNTASPSSVPDGSKLSKSKSKTPLSNATSMNSEEMEMVEEINLIRSNPQGYIPYIESYISNLRTKGDMGNGIETAQELIGELRNTPVLSTLQPLQCVYVAAQKHGLDQIQKGDTDHQGSDGSWPWDRVKRECPDLKDGGENLVGGPSDIRRAVILLLVDDGIEGRGHRKALLNPDWKYVACYKMGQVGSMPNCWTQKFAN